MGFPMESHVVLSHHQDARDGSFNKRAGCMPSVGSSWGSRSYTKRSPRRVWNTRFPGWGWAHTRPSRNGLWLAECSGKVFADIIVLGVLKMVSVSKIRCHPAGTQNHLLMIIFSFPVSVMIGEPDCQYTVFPLPRTVMLLQAPSKVTKLAFPLMTTAFPLQVKVRV